VRWLRPLPGHIREIQASFSFLEMPRGGEPAGQPAPVHHEETAGGARGAPAQNELDRMADAIVSMEFYLETVQQGRGESAVHAGITPKPASRRWASRPTRNTRKTKRST